MSNKKKLDSKVETVETENENTETETTEIVDNVEVVEAPTLVEEGEFTVVSNLKSGGKRYSVGDTIFLTAEEATQLVADGVVK